MKKKKVPGHILKLISSLEEMFDVGSRERYMTLSSVEDGTKALSVEIDDAYQWLHITIYPCFFTATRYQQRKYVLHEFVHTILHPLSHALREFGRGTFVTPQQVTEHIEEATSRVTNLLNGLMRGSYMSYRHGYEAYLKEKKPKKHKRKKVARS